MLKLLASYMVVFIHVSFKGTAGIAVDAVARFAVPFFFVVSGFYSYHISLDKIRKRAKHIFFLLVIATVCHTLCKTALMLLTHDYNGISVYFREYLRPEALARLLLLNMPVHLDYLWYLLAMLYVYYIFYMITNIVSAKEECYPSLYLFWLLPSSLVKSFPFLISPFRSRLSGIMCFWVILALHWGYL